MLPNNILRSLTATALVAGSLTGLSLPARAAEEGVSATYSGDEVHITVDGRPVTILSTDSSDPLVRTMVLQDADGHRYQATEYLAEADAAVALDSRADSAQTVKEAETAGFSTEKADTITDSRSDQVTYTGSTTVRPALAPVATLVEGTDRTVLAMPTTSTAGTVVTKNGEPIGTVSEDGSVVDDDPSLLATDSYEFTIETPNGEMQSVTINDAASTAALNGAMYTSYKTYIPGPRASVPIGTLCNLRWTAGKVWFKGDNRSWVWGHNQTARSRTAALVVADWRNGKREVTLTRRVNPTVRYADGTSTRPVASATASPQGMYLRAVAINSRSAQFTLKHKIGNPLCFSAGPITYQLRATVYRNGSASYYGHSIDVPRHEVYAMSDRRGTWRKVKQRSSTSFMCLSAPQVISPVTRCPGQRAWSAYFNKTI
ncbi:Protein of unknown function [Kytococcus aerolatus]|uniref:DUF3238 domain-containing protein n=1 Tax=Kytococcus aerolatus TaxID=592308 RepID=A0A212U197_9MICO|nr:DUF3238 domain-containing protein [Kytococcus aerolatus]SNC71920.1 Protein of unknown function [Kytococcus aerolatus]